MVNIALAQYTRTHKTAKQNYKHHNAAANAYNVEQTVAEVPQGLRKFAAKTRVPRETIRRRAHGQPSRETRANRELRIPADAEEEIVRWIEGCSDRARPPTNRKINNVANQFLAAQPRPPGQPPAMVGKN
ncbi:uncharacterized protein B0H18DRAFT_1157329, partial [Fomitopsis serialis]|uniref:uncharacterized protein n=1 Tax=Fomitopsis serialis TaxID=139415 RepID=UPI0020085254